MVECCNLIGYSDVFLQNVLQNLERVDLCEATESLLQEPGAFEESL